MKERPILFNGDMVRALLDGRKTQTRRLVKPAPQMVAEKTIKPWEGDPAALLRRLERNNRGCPYGQPGDRLWVRETFAQVGNVDPGYLTYRATYPKCLLARHADLENVPADIRDAGERWRPSIHMPRWASRILLEVTDVRVERLNDISNEDAVAEGIGTPRDMRYAALDGFKPLWELINGAGSWDANPWVWVVEFRVIEPREVAA